MSAVHYCSAAQQVQKLVKAAKDGTKDGLEKTKAAVKKGKSFMRTKSFCSGELMGTEQPALSCSFHY